MLSSGWEYIKDRSSDSNILRRHGVREIGREDAGVKASDFLGMGVIWEAFHVVGVSVV